MSIVDYAAIELSEGPWTLVDAYCEQWIRDCASESPALHVTWKRTVEAVFRMEELRYIEFCFSNAYDLLMCIRVLPSEYASVWRQHFVSAQRVPG